MIVNQIRTISNVYYLIPWHFGVDLARFKTKTVPPYIDIKLATPDPAASAVTASDTTTTSGLGSGLDSPSYFKLVLSCFSPNSCPHAKFYPNQTKNVELKKIGYQLASVGWSGQSKNSRIHLKLM